MPPASPILKHKTSTHDLARALKPLDVYRWLLEYGYFPEAYVLPPCFRVVDMPKKQKMYFDLNKKVNGLKELNMSEFIFRKRN